MCRPLHSLLLSALLLMVALGVHADPEPEPENSYASRYGQRVGRREKPEDTVSLANSGFEPQHETQAETVQASYKLQDDNQNEKVHRRRRTHRHKVRQEAEEITPDGMIDSASSYNPMVMHSHGGQEHRRVPSSMQYKSTKPKPMKVYMKNVRQGFRETTASNFKHYKTIKQEDPPPHNTPQQLSGDHFAHSVHPSIMEKLLKQQPQTFDVAPEKEEQDYEQSPSQVRYEPKESSEHENYEVSKRPIYVPNRVSVQNPSSDSSFNVGYSIGFGGGFQRPKSGIVDPPVNFRQGKGISYASSYQNTPVNVHFDGKNSVWKNMGSGVEMSYNVDAEGKPPTRLSFAEPTESPDYSSLQGRHQPQQPIFLKESFDQSFTNAFPSGRNTFDHNHALQQSNSFDFSNAIDPLSSQPISSDQGPTYVTKHFQPTFSEAFPKHTYSFVEPKPLQTYPETFSKPAHSTIDTNSQLREEPVRPSFPQGGEERQRFEGFRYETQNVERPVFSSPPLGPVKVTSSVNIIPKSKAVDFSKPFPFTKTSYNLKPFPTTNFNQINEDLYGNSFGLSGIPVVPQMYDPVGKPSSAGPMVQAFLVPVNTPVASFPQINVPIVGNGYPPLIGHQFGILKSPSEVPVESSPKEDVESQESDEDISQENSQYTANYQKPSPVFHLTPGKYQKKKISESSVHQSRHPSYSYRSEPSDVPHIKYKRLLTTEAPSYSSSPSKSSFRHPSEYSASTPTPFPSSGHHPRPYRSGTSMIIVKRS